MQTAEKLTSTFILKLVVLFALLLVGVFYRTNKSIQPADVNNYIHPTTTDLEQTDYRLIKHANPNDSSI
jgi:hypothetical protein